ncbi:methionyl-tRNA formyltransferase [Thermobacillus composti KWC4]|uniref:Methionyl-tRNA formyltransferase n=1 Tax=Thermobacillus composti (strain DSM 18247 / JCM 13945 / KWC4) TaxID=717605 RepID=L0EB86_THECK|nr:formyltransferase family protein [Thermobacillus composti]AGA56415.1 methionyl-tRNA formyltransferase [Thermobacillus composti KWC4]
MKVLLLGPQRPGWEEKFRAFGDEMIHAEDRLTGDEPWLNRVDFLVSYGYRHILRPAVFDRFGNRAINLHISLLPWNRGADPNVWSFLEDTPKGVTIHVIDERLDTGHILLQEEVAMNELDTLRTSYNRLTQTIERLFWDNWEQLRACRIMPKAQPRGGSMHYKKDLHPYLHLLTDGWDTPVQALIGRAKLLKERRETD